MLNKPAILVQETPPSPLQIYCNGTPMQLPAAATLAQLWRQLVDTQQISAQQQLAMVVQQQVIPKSQWSELLLQPGDEVLLFNLVAGG